MRPQRTQERHHACSHVCVRPTRLAGALRTPELFHSPIWSAEKPFSVRVAFMMPATTGPTVCKRQLAFTAAHHSIGWRTYRHKQHHVTSCGVYGRLDCRRICRLFHGSSGLRDSGWEAHNKSVRRAEQMRKAPGSAPAACSLVKVGKVGIVEAIITEATARHAQTGTGLSTDERFAQKITRRRAIREP